MPYSTILRKFRNRGAALAAALLVVLSIAPASATLQTDPLALYRTMRQAYDRGAADGWHLADELYYFSTVLDAGRAYELVRRDDPDNLALKGTALDLAARLNYNPLTNADAAQWYVRLAAEQLINDPLRGPEAQALVKKLDAGDADPATLARSADADATANLTSYPNDVEALIDQVDADLRAYALTRDRQYRSLALQRAAQSNFPIASLADSVSAPLFAAVQAARTGDAGYDDIERAAARVIASHRALAHAVPVIGRVLSHQGYLVITAPADEYFGRTKLSPIGVSNEIIRIGKYLDVGWGARMAGDALYVVDALDDWRHQYPRDYALPRLLLSTYSTLRRIDSPAAKEAAGNVRRVLTIEYNASSEARSLLAS